MCNPQVFSPPLTLVTLLAAWISLLPTLLTTRVLQKLLCLRSLSTATSPFLILMMPRVYFRSISLYLTQPVTYWVPSTIRSGVLPEDFYTSPEETIPVPMRKYCNLTPQTRSPHYRLCYP